MNIVSGQPIRNGISAISMSTTFGTTPWPPGCIRTSYRSRKNDAPKGRDRMDDVMDERLPDQEIWVKAIVARQNESQWRVTDGSNAFEVYVEKDVLDRLKRENLKITRGNIFRIRYYIRQSVKNHDLSSQYVVTEILEIKKRMKQIEMPWTIQ